MRTPKTALLALLLIPSLTLSHCGQKGGLTRPEAPPPPTTSQNLAPLPFVNPVDTYGLASATSQSLATPPMTSQRLVLPPAHGLAGGLTWPEPRQASLAVPQR